MTKVPSIKELREICQPQDILNRANEDWYAKLIGRKISIYLTKLFLLLHATPNSVTFLSLIVVLIGSLAFVSSNLNGVIAFFLLFQLSFILDSCDGEIARYSKNFTRLGGLLENVSSTYMSIVLYLSLGTLLWNITGNIMFVFLGSIGALCDVMKDITVYRHLVEVEQALTISSNKTENASVFNFLYKYYSGLKINESYYPRGRVIVFTVVALVNVLFSVLLLQYVLFFYVIIAIALLIFTLYASTSKLKRTAE